MSSALRSGDILRCGNFPLRFEATHRPRARSLAGLVFVSIDGQRQTVMIHPEGGALGTFSGATVIGEHDSIARIHAFVYYDGEQDDRAGRARLRDQDKWSRHIGERHAATGRRRHPVRGAVKFVLSFCATSCRP